jgi:uncharacterized protein (TIGR03382 family)
VRPFQLTNCSGAQLAITNAHIEDDPDDEFTIVQPTTIAGNLASAASLDFGVLMIGHAGGEKVAHLVVEWDGGSATVELDGTVLTAPVPVVPGKDRGSYYNCNAGGAGGGLPIVLALFGLRRRKLRR